MWFSGLVFTTESESIEVNGASICLIELPNVWKLLEKFASDSGHFYVTTREETPGAVLARQSWRALPVGQAVVGGRVVGGVVLGVSKAAFGQWLDMELGLYLNIQERLYSKDRLAISTVYLGEEGCFTWFQ